MDEPPLIIDIPPELKGKVDEILDKYRMLAAMHMADELLEAGLELHIAMHLCVGQLRVSAARMAMLGCGVEKREPRRDLWLQRAAEDFDQAKEWFAQLMAEGGETAELIEGDA